MINILVVDVGTSSMRGTLFSQDGEILMRTQSTYRSEFPAESLVEQDPHSWEGALFYVATEAVKWTSAHGRSIHAITLTAQRSSAIPLDRAGNPLRKAIMWQDRRSSEICRLLGNQSKEIFFRTGLRVSPVMTAPKFAWLKRHELPIYQAAFKLTVIPDYLLFLMTGKFVTDETYGSRTLLMSLKTRTWDSELLRLFDLDEHKLCELVRPGSIVGDTTEAFKARTGIATGTPVISAGGDQQCAALGAGIGIRDVIQITSGTGSYIVAAAVEPTLDLKMRFLCSAAAIPDRFMLESSTLTASALYSWAANAFYGLSIYDTSALKPLAEDAASSPVGANGVIMLPYPQGRGTPDWNSAATGSFANITLATTRGDLVRAVLEGVAAEISENLEILLDYAGPETRLFVAGGLTNLPLFNQIQADTYHRPVWLPRNRETTSLGAWISAAVAIGVYDSYESAFDMATHDSEVEKYVPIAKNVPVYRRLKLEKERFYRTLVDAGHFGPHMESSRESGGEK